MRRHEAQFEPITEGWRGMKNLLCSCLCCTTAVKIRVRSLALFRDKVSSLQHLMLASVCPHTSDLTFGCTFFKHTNVRKLCGQYSANILPVYFWLIMEKASARWMKTRVGQALWPQEQPLFIVIKDFWLEYVIWQWGVLGKIWPIMNRGFVKSLTKDQ